MMSHPDPFKGRVYIGEHSSLRKLMRAANRDRIPEERAFKIMDAMANAEKRMQKQRDNARH
jgi:hypothetical protein